MYFSLLPGYYEPKFSTNYQLVHIPHKYIKNDNEKVIIFLKNLSEVEKIQPWIEKDIDDDFTYYGISKKNLRKLKILSLSNDKIKNKLIELEKLISNENRVHIYGEEKPDFSYYFSYSGSNGTSGTSGTSGPDPLQNRFARLGDLKKHFDFYRNKNKNLYKGNLKRHFRKV